jgi:hypothetical protein
MGYFGLMSPFEPVNAASIGDVLERMGYDRACDTTLYNGQTGEMMTSMIFSGPLFYQRLKHMVQDKINARSSGTRVDGIAEPGGAYTMLTRQTIGGRALGGGIKIGEMERDCLLSHGIFGFFKESLMERCDKYSMYVSRKTGDIVVANPNSDYGDNIYYNPGADGPLEYQLMSSFGEDNFKTRKEILGLDLSLQHDMDLIKVDVPYSLKLLIQEVQGIGISMKMRLASQGIALQNERVQTQIISDGDGDMDYNLEDYDSNIDSKHLPNYMIEENMEYAQYLDDLENPLVSDEASQHASESEAEGLEEVQYGGSEASRHASQHASESEVEEGLEEVQYGGSEDPSEASQQASEAEVEEGLEEVQYGGSEPPSEAESPKGILKSNQTQPHNSELSGGGECVNEEYIDPPLEEVIMPSNELMVPKSINIDLDLEPAEIIESEVGTLNPTLLNQRVDTITPIEFTKPEVLPDDNANIKVVKICIGSQSSSASSSPIIGLSNNNNEKPTIEERFAKMAEIMDGSTQPLAFK